MKWIIDQVRPAHPWAFLGYIAIGSAFTMVPVLLMRILS